MHCKPTASDPKQILEQEKGTVTINYTLLTKDLGVLTTHPNNRQQTGARQQDPEPDARNGDGYRKRTGNYYYYYFFHIGINLSLSIRARS